MHHVMDRPGSGDRLEAQVGDSLEIRLPRPGATGYQWYVADAPSSVVAGSSWGTSADAPAGGPSEDGDPLDRPLPGAGGTAVLELVAASPGEGQLRLELRRAWEDEPADDLVIDLVITDPTPVE